jgi:hypothetical protein
MMHPSLRLVGFLCLVVPVALVGADPKVQEKVAGVWKVTAADKLNETWTFTFADDKWEIKGVYTKNGREVGSAHGTKVRELKDGLNFTRVFDKKPASDLGDDALTTFKLKDSGGELIFRAGGKTSIRQVKREEDATAAKPKAKAPDPKTEPAPKAAGPFAELAQIKGSKSLSSMTLGISPDGKRAAMVSAGAGGTTNTVAIWDLAEKKVVRRIKPVGRTERLAWSADGKSLATLQLTFATAEAKPQLAVWDSETGEQRAMFEAPKFASVIAICADGSVVAAANGGIIGDDGFVMAWDVVAKKEIFSQEIVSTLSTIGLTADGKTLMAVGVKPSRQTVLFDLKTGKPRVTFKAIPERSILSADGKLVVGTSYENGSSKLHVFDTANPTKPPRVIQGGKGRIDCLALVDNNRHVIVAGSSDEVHDIDLATGKIVNTFVPAKNLLTIALTTTSDSAYLLTLSGDYVARLWSTPFGPKQ